jgi:membrane protease YdiL (CAAX protease family)
VPETEGDLLYILLSFPIVAVVSGLPVLYLWLKVLGPHRRWLPLPRQRAAGWSGGEVFFTFLLMMCAPLLAQGFLDGIGFFDAFYQQKPTDEQRVLWIMPLAAPLMVALIIAYLYVRSGTRPARLGLTRARWPHNVVAGYLCWLVLAPVVFLVHFGVLLVFKNKPHPFELLMPTALPVEWLLVFFATLIAAPVSEELIFRGILQGWLRRASPLGHYVIAACTLLVAHLPWLGYLQDKDKSRPSLEPTYFTLLCVGFYLLAVNHVFRRRSEGQIPAIKEAPATEIVSENGTPNQSQEIMPKDIDPIKHASPPAGTGFLAILGTSLLFVAIHTGVWPAWIPLLLLSIGLGWLAFRTQSLIGPIVLHALFNSISCVALLLQSLSA